MSFLYLYAAVISVLPIPLWFTANWCYTSEDDGEMVTGLHTTYVGEGHGWLTAVWIAMYVATVIGLLIPLVRSTVHEYRMLLWTRIASLLTLIYTAMITIGVAVYVEDDETLSNFHLNAGCIMLMVFCFLSFVLQTVISIRSRQYKPAAPKTKKVSGRAGGKA